MLHLSYCTQNGQNSMEFFAVLNAVGLRRNYVCNVFQSGQRSFSLTFPEESQDLYGNTMPELGPTQYKQTQESQKLNFFLEDSQSNMLDADG